MNKIKAKSCNNKSATKEAQLFQDTQAGISALDNLLSGHEKGQVVCMTRNKKKSDMIDIALYILFDVLINKNKSVGFFSSKFTNAQIVKKFLLLHAELSKDEFSRKDFNKDDFSKKWEKFIALAQYLEKSDLSLYSDKDLDLDKINSKANELAINGKLDFLIIHLADFSNDSGILKSLQELAESLNINIVVPTYKSKVL